ncbi:hypothetical protein B0T11DRAFT_271532 [Plectosphaerella cucumerina]|uniref:Uncharacterized protein n=1 Tax=Plectosphaerella cucumerina TaxID=40658 RepID=A0A8K0X9W0_9PEZI|nr:hypothetical protein B0T11DRAFT_271532 [Plectosphaerella cucumerina]
MDEENVQEVFVRLADALERIAVAFEEMAEGQIEANLRLEAVEETVVGTTKSRALGLLTLVVGICGATAFTRQGRAAWLAIRDFLVWLFWAVVGICLP